MRESWAGGLYFGTDSEECCSLMSWCVVLMSGCDGRLFIVGFGSGFLFFILGLILRPDRVLSSRKHGFESV